MSVESRKGKGRKRREYLVEWSGDWEPSWVDARHVSADLVEEFEKEQSEKGDRRIGSGTCAKSGDGGVGLSVPDTPLVVNS